MKFTSDTVVKYAHQTSFSCGVANAFAPAVKIIKIGFIGLTTL
jgi:hypothetical protein